MPLSDRPLPGTKDLELGEVVLQYFVELGGLTPDEAVLEPGCGTGRMAEPVSRYLTTGSYDGFDVVREAIEQCETRIMQPNFRFRHVDVLNRFYNPEGRIQPDEFQFPYPDESFDFVFLTSVFTRYRYNAPNLGPEAGVGYREHKVREFLGGGWV
jgi:ubiquinone/menaquinone biosynthesis C-methylase UbiE